MLPIYYALKFQKVYTPGEVVLSELESVMSVTGALKVSHSDEVTMPAGADTHKSLPHSDIKYYNTTRYLQVINNTAMLHIQSTVTVP